MAQELDYLKIKVGADKTNAYIQDTKSLHKKVQIEAITQKDIVAHVAKSAQNLTKDLTLTTKDKQELINNIASNTHKTINPFLSEDNKILDTKQFAKDITQEMKKSQPKQTISKSVRAEASRLGERIKEAKNKFVKKVQDINPFKKKEGQGR
jgi:hypothetical protein